MLELHPFLQDFCNFRTVIPLLADREISMRTFLSPQKMTAPMMKATSRCSSTPEQQANFASGGYYILCKAKEEGYITSEEDPRADEDVSIHSGKQTRNTG